MLLVIVGPTASGKSEYAVRIALKYNGEIISADSRQVYRALDIGTGKVGGQWSVVGGKKLFLYKNIPHHCIDFVSPKKIYTAAEYKKCAERAIEDIRRRGRLPIIAGGTAFWIDAIARGMTFPRVPPNPTLRRTLEKKTAAELFLMLKKRDPRRAQTIEQKNPRRLIRAIEIAQELGRVPRLAKTKRKDAFWIGIFPGEEELDRRIKKRAKAMLGRGLVREVKTLLRKRIPRKRLHEFGFEYRLTLAAAEGKITDGELRARLIQKTKQYARRQMSWWRRNKAIHWMKNRDEIIELLGGKLPGFALRK